MPRIYVRQPENRPYMSYSEESVLKAIKLVNENRISLRKASRDFGIPYGTLFNRVNGLHKQKVGGQTFLSEDQETDLRKAIELVGEWGFPLTPASIGQLVKTFLDDNNINSRFPDNRPGSDWILAFVARSNSLTTRRTENIKRSRAKVSPDIINQYFGNLDETLKDVPPENILNFDETNCSDDPESKKVIVRRGQRYVENVLDHSKTSYSVMFAGSASGVMMPLYVVYAAVHLYPEWTVGAPKNFRFNRTNSGWFDSVVVEDWFDSVALPYFKRLPNDKPRVLIGDNVASHLSYGLVKKCLDNNIRMVFLPPNATHLCQPLDVSFFRPFKKAWKTTLENWKKQYTGCIPKHWFPRLLKRTLESIEPNIPKNIRAGFRAAGIFPLDKRQVLKRIPNAESAQAASNENVFSKQLIQLLQDERFGKQAERAIPKRKRLVDIEPGASVSETQALQLLQRKLLKEKNSPLQPIGEPEQSTTFKVEPGTPTHSAARPRKIDKKKTAENKTAAKSKKTIKIR